MGHAPTLLPGAGRHAPPPPAVAPSEEPTALAVQAPLPPEVPAAGLVLDGRYKLVRCIGRGGMGEVWEAVHMVIGRKVAIKLVTPERASTGDAVVMERFLREAQVIAAVDHEAVVEILDYGTAPGSRPYYVMELLDGRTLAERVKREGPLPWTEACRLLEQVASGLAAVHERGIVHRDLKPDNIFLVAERTGGLRAKIIDFGIAKSNALDPSARTFTKTGMVFGTPAYMSPEQARGERVDLRADVYALGCVAFHAVTGRMPFPAENATKMLFHHLFTEPEAPSAVRPKAQIPRSFDAWVLRCMRKEPQNRFATMHEAIDALRVVAPDAACVPVPAEASMPIVLGEGGDGAAGLTTSWGKTAGSASGSSVPADDGDPRRGRGHAGWAVAAVLVAGALATAGYVGWSRTARRAAANPAPAPAVTNEIAAPAAPAVGAGVADAPADGLAREEPDAPSGNAVAGTTGTVDAGDRATAVGDAEDGGSPKPRTDGTSAPAISGERERRQPHRPGTRGAPSPAPPAPPELESWDDVEETPPSEQAPAGGPEHSEASPEPPQAPEAKPDAPSEPLDAPANPAPPPEPVKKKPNTRFDGDLIDPGFGD
ncbi:MAG: serine/threonine protein kinase [Deltaproteobacteria bacterium]|nr:MAG: serine/threonine protein kinase [Deltaproteobacteria bacterium]